ncbi:MAG: DUF192 domain-containing protein [Cyanobacteria bacterium]|nr:DUF192 domain-containing protein [Cyanobacteriota bacterium]
MLFSINHSKVSAAVAVFALATQLFTLQAMGKMPTVKIGKNKVNLEVAQTDAEIQRGLMFRTSLGKDSGMVFLFSPRRGVRFWMFHTLIPLDMLFVKDGKIVKLLEQVPPCKSEDPRKCPTYPDKDVEVDQVIELNGGYCKNHNVKEGDSVEFDL